MKSKPRKSSGLKTTTSNSIKLSNYEIQLFTVRSNRPKCKCLTGKTSRRNIWRWNQISKALLGDIFTKKALEVSEKGI